MRHCARRGFCLISPKGLDGIDNDEGSFFFVFQGRQYIFNAGFSTKANIGFFKTKALGTKTDLVNRFLARNINDPMALIGERAGCLQ